MTYLNDTSKHLTQSVIGSLLIGMMTKVRGNYKFTRIEIACLCTAWGDLISDWDSY